MKTRASGRAEYPTPVEKIVRQRQGLFKPVCKLNARWAGTRPRRGHWLKAARARTAYEILSVERRKPFGRGYTLVLTVLRHPPSDIPPGAKLWPWIWDKRERRRRP